METNFLASLAERAPQCRYVKLEDEPSPTKITQLLTSNPNIVVFGGLGGIMFLEELRRGAAGTMTGFSFPEILVDIHRLYQFGDHDRAREVFFRHLPLIRFENQPRMNLALRKHIYKLRGAIECDCLRMPAFPLDPESTIELRQMLAILGLMAAN